MIVMAATAGAQGEAVWDRYSGSEGAERPNAGA